MAGWSGRTNSPSHFYFEASTQESKDKEYELYRLISLDVNFIFVKDAKFKKSRYT